MLFREIIAVCCENYTEHINTVCGEMKSFFNVKADGIYVCQKVLSHVFCQREASY
jgi:hypothetical protein